MEGGCRGLDSVADGAGGDATGGEHYDQGSVITVDIMLSDAMAELKGGRFQTSEADGTTQTYDFEQGDALVFVSHKFHGVAPLLSGCRQV